MKVPLPYILGWLITLLWGKIISRCIGVVYAFIPSVIFLTSPVLVTDPRPSQGNRPSASI